MAQKQKKTGAPSEPAQPEPVYVFEEGEALGPTGLTSKQKLQVGLAWGMLTLFGLTICATISMIILNGLHVTQIPNEIVIALVGATIAETGGMLILILQSVFGGQNSGQEQ